MDILLFCLLISRRRWSRAQAVTEDKHETHVYDNTQSESYQNALREMQGLHCLSTLSVIPICRTDNNSDNK